MSEGWRINMVGCTDAILQELTFAKITRKSVGLSYAMAIKSEMQEADKPDWQRINAAIFDKWGRKGLETVKTRAWRLIEGKEQP